MPAKSPALTPQHCVIECVPGLAAFTADELADALADRRQKADLVADGDEISCTTAALTTLTGLRTAQAVYDSETFAVPRPKALLGDQHFRRLTAQINRVIASQPRGAFRTLHLAAAGAESSVMTRIKTELAAAVGLEIDDEAGDLLIRIRKGRQEEVWETLVRLTPRPLATRYWRVCDMPGALSAPVAHVMSRMVSTEPGALVNLMSGTNSIAIEHVLKRPGAMALAIDNDTDVLACGLENARAAHVADLIIQMQEDVTRLSLDTGSIDALCADMPFGQKVGSHQDNVKLYPRVLREAARIARPGARFAVLTHEIRLMTALLSNSAEWHPTGEYPITLRGLHPRIYLLERRGG